MTRRSVAAGYGLLLVSCLLLAYRALQSPQLQAWQSSRGYGELFSRPKHVDAVATEVLAARYMKTARPGPHWHGWSHMSHMIIFGDSWTMTDYHHDRERASPQNPLGNPGWPGITSTAGPNWVGYLTYKFNASLLLTANFAVGGATVDYRLVRSGVPHFIPSDLGAQVNKYFGAGYIGNTTYDWHPDSAVFVIWMGINDIHEQDNITESFFPQIFELFAARMDELYHYGARNMVFMNVPPLELTPLAVDEEHDRLERLVSGWNRNLTSLVQNITDAYQDLSTFHFDTYQLYLDVLQNPCILPQTCDLIVLEGFCPPYAFAWKWEDPDCPYHVNKYFWLNDFHPTSPVHNVTAAALGLSLAAVQPYDAS